MAKGNQDTSANTENTSTETAAASPAAAAGGGDKRAIVLPNGEKRADYIRRRWGEGASRSEITAELNTPELHVGDKKIPYQIVFQATKGVAGGPPPKTEAAPAAAEASS